MLFDDESSLVMSALCGRLDMLIGKYLNEQAMASSPELPSSIRLDSQQQLKNKGDLSAVLGSEHAIAGGSVSKAAAHDGKNTIVGRTLDFISNKKGGKKRQISVEVSDLNRLNPHESNSAAHPQSSHHELYLILPEYRSE